MSETPYQERLMELDLREVLGRDKPPDLMPAAVARLRSIDQESGATGQVRHSREGGNLEDQPDPALTRNRGTVMPLGAPLENIPPGTKSNRGNVSGLDSRLRGNDGLRATWQRLNPRERFGVGLAAASVVVGVGLMLWPSPPRVTNVELGPTASARESGGWVELRKGWLLADERSGGVRAGDARLSGLRGRAVVVAGDADVTNPEFLQWLETKNVEVAMAKDVKRWLKTGGASVLMLTGTALLNGEVIGAQDAEGKKPTSKVEVLPEDTIKSAVPADANAAAEPAVVSSVASIEALPMETKRIRGVNLADEHLSFLERFKNLEYLDVSGNTKITVKGVEYIAKLTSLEYVDTRGCSGIEFSDEGGTINDVGVLSVLPRLRVIGLDAGGLYVPKDKKLVRTDVGGLIVRRGEKGSRDFEAVEQVLLRVPGPVSADRLEDCIVGKPEASLIVGLDLSGTNVNDTGLRHVAKLKNLSSLNLSDCQNITDAGLAHLATLSAMRELVLSKCPLSSDFLAQIAKMKALESLDVSSCNNVGQGLAYLSGHPALRRLDLSHTTVADVELATCALPALETLRLRSNSRMTDAAFAHIAKYEKLRVLDVGDCQQMCGVGIKELTKLPHLEDLTLLLYASGTNVLGDVAAALKECKELRRLAFLSRGFTSPSVYAHLAEIPKLETLDIGTFEPVEVGKNQNMGMTALAKSSSLRTLKLNRKAYNKYKGGSYTGGPDDLRAAKPDLRIELTD